ncbi:MAG TPA: hypothetical protein VMU88_02705 [bacterium]|nr:hypothetical protein [bacterium]
MDLRKIGVKFYVEKDNHVPLSVFIPIFHRFIQEDNLEGLLIDVAQYTHVHQGPGVLLIAHEANYSFDETHGHRGLLYTQKRPAEKGGLDHLKTAFRRALLATELLEKQPELSGKMTFATNHFQVFVNDRLAAPHNSESQEDLENALKTLFDGLYEGASTVLMPDMNRQNRTGFEVHVDKAISRGELLKRLASN